LFGGGSPAFDVVFFVVVVVVVVVVVGAVVDVGVVGVVVGVVVVVPVVWVRWVYVSTVSLLWRSGAASSLEPDDIAATVANAVDTTMAATPNAM
jgi:hypothetical protein